jgi:hypothetical protein
MLQVPTLNLSELGSRSGIGMSMKLTLESKGNAAICIEPLTETVTLLIPC